MKESAPPLITWFFALAIAGMGFVAAAGYSYFVLGDVWYFLS